MTICVPDRCLPLLREQRTHYRDIRAEYGREIEATFATFRDYLPETADNILDIGSGMAGIDVLLGGHYPEATLHLLDKSGVSPRINAGFNERAEDFAHYNDFDAAKELLSENGIHNPVVCHDMHRDPFPDQVFDVVISLLSWGFHYPVNTYAPRCFGVMVVDVRRDTGGEQALTRFGEVSVLHEAQKFRRVLVRC
jgi:hypothetical protein